MESNRISPGQSQPPAVGSTKQREGEQAFHDLAKSKGNTEKELEDATTERTKLTKLPRGRKADKGNKKYSSLFLVSGKDETEEAAEYYTVLDPTTGQIMTLRLLAVA